MSLKPCREKSFSRGWFRSYDISPILRIVPPFSRHSWDILGFPSEIYQRGPALDWTKLISFICGTAYNCDTFSCPSDIPALSYTILLNVIPLRIRFLSLSLAPNIFLCLLEHINENRRVGFCSKILFTFAIEFY